MMYTAGQAGPYCSWAKPNRGDPPKAFGHRDLRRPDPTIFEDHQRCFILGSSRVGHGYLVVNARVVC